MCYFSYIHVTLTLILWPWPRYSDDLPKMVSRSRFSKFRAHTGHRHTDRFIDGKKVCQYCVALSWGKSCGHSVTFAGETCDFSRPLNQSWLGVISDVTSVSCWSYTVSLGNEPFIGWESITDLHLPLLAASTRFTSVSGWSPREIFKDCLCRMHSVISRAGVATAQCLNKCTVCCKRASIYLFKKRLIKCTNNNVSLPPQQ